MPNGVICGGAVDGSNQLGEIVTCQASVARPAGGPAAAAVAVATRVVAARGGGRTRRKRTNRYDDMMTLQAPTQTNKLEWRWQDGLRLCASQSRVEYQASYRIGVIPSAERDLSCGLRGPSLRLRSGQALRPG